MAGQSNLKKRHIATMEWKNLYKIWIYKIVASDTIISNTNKILCIGNKFQTDIISKIVILKKKFAVHYSNQILAHR